ncbi:TolC family protein [Bdellovibrio bacteriovorus]|uniref:Putative outer membrane secretion protein n=1 Tax=Bdellovibrio bacteriovorus str. Tiberius TaxID=1069642 RepID=K7ZAA6_BDEBC|nr:TolC family protein [Bdellovibrio bacteriovorus]AFY01574.1 putative outer membrane secretion protein [Bdellovibrio bacteriovorus str. Tiberius]
MITLKYYGKVLVVGALLGGSLHSQAAGLHLQDALNEALNNSPKVQKSESQYRETGWKKTESYSGFLPTLSAQASYLFDKKYALVDVNLNNVPLAIPQVVPTTNAYLTAQWSVFDGFASTNRYLSADAFNESAKSDFDWTRFQVQREVTVLFYKALAAKELKTVAEQNVRALEDHLKDVRLFKKVGSSTNYDVLRVEVQMSEAQSELLNATDNVELSRGRLSESLGMDQDVPEVDGILPRLSPEVVAKLDKATLEDRKDLQALRQRAEGFKHQEDSAEKYWVPRISLIGQYQYYNNRNDRFDDFDQFRDAYQFGVMLNWNLFDGMTSISRSKQSIEQKYQAEKTVRQAELKSQRDFDMWKKKFLYYCKVYEARLNDISKSEESVRLAREGQKVGARTNTDVLDAEAELYRARAGAVNAQVGAIEAIVNLELSTGQQLVNFN